MADTMQTCFHHGESAQLSCCRQDFVYNYPYLNGCCCCTCCNCCCCQRSCSRVKSFVSNPTNYEEVAGDHGNITRYASPAAVVCELSTNRGCGVCSSAGESSTTVDDVDTNGINQGDKGSVRCMTVKGRRLFVVRKPANCRIEVYKARDLTFHRYIYLEGLGYCVYGMVSCDANNCLYLSDFHNRFIHRLNLSGEKSVVKWKVKGGWPRGVAMNSQQNLLVTCWGESSHKLIEYTTRGQLIREIRLQDDVVCPQHAVPLIKNRFVLSYSSSSRHQVCVVDGDGHVLIRYGKKPGSANGQLNGPKQLAVDRNGFIYVTDRENNRIVVLDQSLHWLRNIEASVEDGLKRPFALLVVDQLDRLLVSEWSGKKRVVSLNI